MFAGYEDDPAVRSIVVSYSTNILVNVLTALVAFRLLRQLRFSVNESVAGVLGAAVLHHASALHAEHDGEQLHHAADAGWDFPFNMSGCEPGTGGALVMRLAALGLNLLTRLTTGLDLIAAGIFLLLVLWFEKVRGRELWSGLLAYCKIAAPVYAFFVDCRSALSVLSFRIVHQYLSYRIFAKEQRLQDPTLPANFPWSTPFHEGVLGPLFKPEKSIFLFDPLLVLAIVLL